MPQIEGNVTPSESPRKRGSPGILGNGTPGSRLKAKWKASGTRESLKEWVFSGTLVLTREELADVERWVESKRPGGGDDAVAERRERRREQQSIRAMAKAAKKASGGNKGKSKSKGKGKGDAAH